MNSQIKQYQARVEAYLGGCFGEELAQKNLLAAMRYSLLAGGKRIRPILAMAFCEACGTDGEAALPFGCAVEMVHTYSLIHDDLPCMDDDDYRRGRPTCHTVYGEAYAILAGDGLLTAAFEEIAGAPADAEKKLQVVRELAGAAGPYGMVAGQQLDMEGEGKRLDTRALELLQTLKTGAMIRAACRIGVIAAGGTKQQLNAADRYAENLGLAFQIRDDMLDWIGSPEELGKPVGSDEKNEKCTFVTACGLEACGRRVERLTQTAIAALTDAGFRKTDFLEDLAKALSGRTA